MMKKKIKKYYGLFMLKKSKYVERTSSKDDNWGLVYRGMKVKRIRFIKKNVKGKYKNNKNYFYLNFGLRTIDDEHIDLVKGGEVKYFDENQI